MGIVVSKADSILNAKTVFLLCFIKIKTQAICVTSKIAQTIRSLFRYGADNEAPLEERSRHLPKIPLTVLCSCNNLEAVVQGRDNLGNMTMLSTWLNFQKVSKTGLTCGGLLRRKLKKAKTNRIVVYLLKAVICQGRHGKGHKSCCK